MDYNNLMGIKDIFFSLITTFFAVFYFLYALVISKQVKVMDKTIQDSSNWLILFVTSLQVTISLVILIIVLLTTFLI